MKKSGLITGGAALLLTFGAAIVISPLCAPCLTAFLGLLAGYLTGAFDRPDEQSRVIKSGALAGLLGGIGMLLGQVLGAVVNGVTVGPEGIARMLAQMGVPAGGPAQVAQYYWIALSLSTACLIVFDVALISGFGALGGLLWWKISGNMQNPTMSSFQP